MVSNVIEMFDESSANSDNVCERLAWHCVVNGNMNKCRTSVKNKLFSFDFQLLTFKCVSEMAYTTDLIACVGLFIGITA